MKICPVEAELFHAHRETDTKALQGYFYSKANQMHNISNLFYFVTTLYMFRTISSSIIRSLRLYIQHHTIQVLWLLASKQPHPVCVSLYDTHIGTRYVILAKHWMWLPDDCFMWTETWWDSFYNFNYFNNLRIYNLCALVGQ